MVRVIFSIQHPAHVHLFRNVIAILKEEGHAVRVYAREKDITSDLLDLYNINHEILAPAANSLLRLAQVEVLYEYRLFKHAREFNPDVMVAMGGVAISRPALLTGAKCMILTDTEHATLQNTIAFPFADRILTPECYQADIGSKQVRYPGYHELAYLHPDRFEPDPSILEEANLARDEQFVILRLVSWDAMHDIGDGGFDDAVDVVHALEDTGTTVRITSEADLPSEIEDRQVLIPPHKIHDLMAFADLYVGESATMATESAVLGTPAIFVSSSRRGYTDELENDFELVYNFCDENRHEDGINKATDILKSDNKVVYNQRKKDMLKRKINVSEFIFQQILDIYQYNK